VSSGEKVVVLNSDSRPDTKLKHREKQSKKQRKAEIFCLKKRQREKRNIYNEK